MSAWWDSEQKNPFTYRNPEIINMYFKPLSLCYAGLEDENSLPSSFSSQCFSHSDLFLVSQLKHYSHDCGFVEIFTMSGLSFSSFLPVKYNSSFKTQIDSASSRSLNWFCTPPPLPELVESKNLYYSCSCHLELGQGLQHNSHSVYLFRLIHLLFSMQMLLKFIQFNKYLFFKTSYSCHKQ